MRKKILIVQGGFTVIELMITAVISIIVIFSVGILLVDGQRGWNKMYNRAYGDVTTDSYIARGVFDRVVRKAHKDRFLLDDNGDWIKVYYYADNASTDIDRYARLFKDGSELKIEYGEVYGEDNSELTLDVETICNNVSNCIFTKSGRSVQMILTLDDDTHTITTTSSAFMHNP